MNRASGLTRGYLEGGHRGQLVFEMLAFWAPLEEVHALLSVVWLDKIAPTSAIPARSIARPATDVLRDKRSSLGSKIAKRRGTPCQRSEMRLTARGWSPE